MMRNKHIYIIFILCALLINNSIVYSQEVKAVLTPSTGGYQNIQIPQEFTAIIGTAINKVRIKDKSGNEVPYIERKELIKESTFTEQKYTLSKNDSLDIITIENPKKESKLNYTLKISNTSASKNYVIEGSDDLNNWFSLVNKGTLTDLESSSNTFVYKIIDFPLTQFKYIRILINNRNSSPIQLLAVGEYGVKSIAVQYDKLRNTSYVITEDKENKTTIIEVSKFGKNPFDLISFHINNKTDYFRPAYIYSKEIQTTVKRGVRSERETEANYYDFNLASNQSNIFQFNFDAPKDKFYIAIINDINTPLKIDSIELLQKPLFITANLDANEIYTFEADEQWPLAVYDLNKLNLNLPNDLALIQAQNVKLISKDIAVENVGKSDKKNSWILIIGLCAAVLITFYFGRSLIKDMNKNN